MREYTLIALVAAAVTYLLVPLVRVFALRIGAAPEIRERDVHTVRTPRLGGLAMYAGMLAGLFVASRLDHIGATLADPTVGEGQTVIALALAGGVIVLTGFLDDWWGMDALVKLGGQIAAAGLLVAFKLTLLWVPLPNGNTVSLDSTLQTVITILVVVVAINAVNFVDGLDGLAAGIVGIAAMATFVWTIALTDSLEQGRLSVTAAITAILIGMCLGFLPHNFHPSKIFMGDTGAMLIGLVLATSVVTVTGTVDYRGASEDINRFPVVLPILLPLAVMVLPLADLVMAVIRRTSHGKSPLAPDRGHLHHRLLQIGHSHRRTVLIMYAWSFLFAATVVGFSVGGVPLIVFPLVVLFAIIVLLLMGLPRWRSGRGKGGAHSSRRGPGPGSGPADPPVAEGTSRATAATG
ncbi:undecaprenyl-phosphate alpha-N-acetylglucosaminyl 1-phosphate transferase [Sphaerisporangium siamense]|uniref:UDP-GlcNAc:undecaprenyl-phosphate GlcNAc-1-phosphate transferase n=1 Tax=Sphaerisporangium siamense TaxID=795645 RepID=A0A7W7DF56_9ACTN|nr:MraY family glycosyltransferase [Sphaerisporangium siamense]MBB4705658.1 UDP-GlcNAc:undecaprenyl-phosphate GlcNAc-1-phosphate transferase [Sphaerisporangium siamense]GII82958.1 undecaprenyl-phosphate alpha-N-acetylglucosaminyl 1-phosphate transferase [Sphaerisporangium siamense]